MIKKQWKDRIISECIAVPGRIIASVIGGITVYILIRIFGW